MPYIALSKKGATYLRSHARQLFVCPGGAGGFALQAVLADSEGLLQGSDRSGGVNTWYHG